MIPRLANFSKVEGTYQSFLEALPQAGFTGDLEARYSARLLCATDNSVYQRMPQAVIFPKSKQDVVKVFKLAQESRFKSIVFAPRGGGTGTNGQSLTSGIVIDMSRHMKGIEKIDALARSVWVEAGVIKDELNEALAPYNLFFSPELSTSSRATIGGMISNDAAGQGSLRYGRTSEHITEVEVVLIDGTLTKFGQVSSADIAAACNKPGLEGQIYQACYDLLKANAAKVAKDFPQLNRFMTGYDMAHAYDAATDTLNLARLVCGAEGTLCTVVGAKLDLTLQPVFRALCVIKYENFDSALRHANELIKAGAFSVETVDSKVLGLAKKDPVWLSVKDYIQDVPGAEIDGVNIVEFNGYEADSERKLMERLYKDTQRKAEKRTNGILGAQIADTKAAIAAVYGMRKKAVGLLGSAAGAKKLVAFTEDTAVPPENLADYILEFRALLDGMGVEYGMFGHVDTGLMHVRPALDLTQDDDKRKFIEISNGVVELVKKYGGQMWGEHGRGYRSCFGPVFFGELYTEARKIKAIFDPDNRLNPGKICVPWGNEKDQIVALDSLMRGDLDRTIKLNVRQSFEGALNCNGNGQCFSYSTSALMCPSYRYTKDHVKSPKGYSGLMREWLRLMTERGWDAEQIEQELNATVQQPWLKQSWLNLQSWVKRAGNTLFEHDDFNHEYLEEIDTCLACKSCKTQCPAHVNSAELNSRFLNFYYSRYLRPSMDLLCLNAERTTPYLAASFPQLSNKVLKLGLTQWALKKIFHFVDVPLFSEETLAQQARKAQVPLLNYKEALRRARHFDVIIVSDVFTSSYEVEGLIDLATVVRGLGFRVALLKPYVNGKLFIIRGARGRFIKYATVQAKRLSDLEGMGVTLLGFDPALTLCYRDEYPSLVPNCPSFKVLLPEEWLERALSSAQFKQRAERFAEALELIVPQGGAAVGAEAGTAVGAEGAGAAKGAGAAAPKSQSAIPSYGDFAQDYHLFCHCTEQALVPLSVKQWQKVMAAFHINVKPVPVACCGMAGLFGHMERHQAESKGVYQQNWQPKLHERGLQQCLVTGFSCRSQVERMEGQKANHPLHVLAEIVKRINQTR